MGCPLHSGGLFPGGSSGSDPFPLPTAAAGAGGHGQVLLLGKGLRRPRGAGSSQTVLLVGRAGARIPVGLVVVIQGWQEGAWCSVPPKG